jgi:hypothetical protein
MGAFEILSMAAGVCGCVAGGEAKGTALVVEEPLDVSALRTSGIASLCGLPELGGGWVPPTPNTGRQRGVLGPRLEELRPTEEEEEEEEEEEAAPGTTFFLHLLQMLLRRVSSSS